MKVICIENPPNIPTEVYVHAPDIVVGETYEILKAWRKGSAVCGYILPQDYYNLVEIGPNAYYASECFVPIDDSEFSDMTVENLLKEIEILQHV